MDPRLQIAGMTAMLNRILTYSLQSNLKFLRGEANFLDEDFIAAVRFVGTNWFDINSNSYYYCMMPNEQCPMETIEM